MPLKYNYKIITPNENYTRKFNLFWISISLAIVNPLQNLQFVIKLQVFIKFHLASHFRPYLKKELKFSTKKNIHSLLILDYTLICVNESYSTFVVKSGFFTHENLSKKPQIFYKLKMCDKVLFSICTLKQKWALWLL